MSRAFRVFTVTPVFFTLALGCAFQSGVLAQDENLANQPKVVDADKAKKDADKIIADLEAQIKKQREDLELLKLFASSLAEIERSYVQKVDRRRLVEAAIDGMLHDLDRYSDYVPPEELESFQTDIESKYGGIGIRVVKRAEEKFITVTTPILGSPSYKAGVQADTFIVKIDDTDAENMTVAEAIEKIKGEIGSKVKVTFLDKKTGEEKLLEIPRAIVEVKTVLGDQRLSNDQWNYFLSRPEFKDEKIAYVRINSFGRQTVQELSRVVFSLKEKGMKGLILDLRFNPGGLLSAAIDICDLFVEKGLIVRTEGRNARPQKWIAKKTGTLLGFPIAVIVNGRSASASEIVAACLKDSGRAVIVGQRTFGKGSVQNIVNLENGKSLMKLTTAAYFRPNGQNINRMPEHQENDIWGVRPSQGYEVPLDADQQRSYFEYRQNRDVIRKRGMMTEPQEKFEDLQLQKAIEYIRKSVSDAEELDNKKELDNKEVQK